MVKKGMPSTISDLISAKEKTFLKKPLSIFFIGYGKGGDYYPVNHQSNAVNFSSSNVGFLYFEA